MNQIDATRYTAPFRTATACPWVLTRIDELVCSTHSDKDPRELASWVNQIDGYTTRKQNP